MPASLLRGMTMAKLTVKRVIYGKARHVEWRLLDGDFIVGRYGGEQEAMEAMEQSKKHRAKNRQRKQTKFF